MADEREDGEDARRSGTPSIRTYHKKDADATYLTKFIYYFDSFGVVQVSDERRAHVCGCVATVLIILLLLFVTIYSIGELFKFRYSQTTGKVADTSLISLDSAVLPPEVGLSCCTNDDTIDGVTSQCDPTGFLKIQMYQRAYAQQARKLRQELALEPCVMMEGSSYARNYTMSCPVGGNFSMQGIFEDDIFRFLDIEVTSCPWIGPKTAECEEGSKVAAWVKKMQCRFLEEVKQYNLTSYVQGTVAYLEDPPMFEDVVSRRYFYVPGINQKINIYHQVRHITWAHWSADIGGFEREQMDLQFSGVEKTYVYLAEEDIGNSPLLEIRVRMDRDSVLVRFAPEANLYGVFEDWGAYWALLSSLGGFLVLMNSKYYARRLMCSRTAENVGAERAAASSL